MKIKSLKIIVFLLAAVTVNAANINWALTNLPEGYIYNDFNEGLVVCCDNITHKYGAINSDGEWVIPAEYDYLSNFNGQCAVVRTEQGVGLINNKNQVILPLQQNREILPLEASKSTYDSGLLTNCFVVLDTIEQKQALFYKDKIVSPFEAEHSVEYDILYPFIKIADNTYINTITDDLFVGSLFDLGSYFLIFDSNGAVIAIDKYTFENVTEWAIGEEISNALSSKKVCHIRFEDGIWQIINAKGKVLQKYEVANGWNCDFPFWQCGMAVFKKELPEGGEQIIIVSMEKGDVICDKTSKGRIDFGLYPRIQSVMPTGMMSMKEAFSVSKSYWNDQSAHNTFSDINGNLFRATIPLYSLPYIVLCEKTLEDTDNIISIVDPISPKKQFVFPIGKTTDYLFYDNLLIYTESGSQQVIYDMVKNKKYIAMEIVCFSENTVLCKDPQEQYFTIHKGKNNKLSKLQNVFAFSDGVSVAENSKGEKVIIDPQGKVLMQDCNEHEIKTKQSSENVILMWDKSVNQYRFAYNPLCTDTLIYNSKNKVESLYALGTTYYSEGKYKKAMRCFKTILDYNPNELNAIIKYADCLNAKRYYSDAINYYDKALEIDPSNTEVVEHRDIAQTKKEKAEYTAAMIQAIGEVAYSALDAANQTYSQYNSPKTSSTSANAQTASSSAISHQTTSSSSGSSSDRNDATYWSADKRTYSNYESQLIKMNTYWETQYNSRDRQYIQSEMRKIRNKWESRGYKMFHSPWEDWDGIKK